jgi:hypothetical protein
MVRICDVGQQVLWVYQAPGGQMAEAFYQSGFVIA